MTPLFLYLLKVNIALALFYLAYRFGLRRLTFYTLNRFYLLFAIGFSSVYPLINVNTFFPGTDIAGSEIIHYLPDLNGLAEKSPLELWSILTVVFWSGVAVMAIRFMLQCVSLARIHFSSVKQHTEEQDLRFVMEKINPFSFFRNIYINPLLHSQEERQAIIAHERVHVREWHTADVLAGELNRIFYWFNPGAWLMITAIRENLEFITDRRILRGGTDLKTYQYCLIKASSIPYASALANNFNFSHLKTRITMMDKKPSSEMHLVKYLLLIPFVAALALAFNVSRAAFTPPVIVKFTEPLIVSNDTLPEKEQVKEVRFTPPTIVKDSIPPPRITEVRYASSEDTTRRASAIKQPQGKVNKKDVMISCCRVDSASKKTPLYIIDGEQVSSLEGIDPDQIASVSILKDKQATSMFGRKGDNGVVLIITKENSVAVTLEQNEEVKKEEVKKDISQEQDILILIDDVAVSAEEVKLLAPDKIKSVNVLKDEHATDKYGKKGENGVIEIITKDRKD